MNLIELRAVSKRFSGDVQAVAEFSLTVGRGEFVTLLGPSGCGKSTILRMIAGLEKTDSGSVHIASRKIAYVFQDAHLLPWRTVLQNVTLPLEFAAAAPTLDARNRAAQETLAQLGLGDAIHLYPNQLSGGMKMRVSLARALVTEPDLLLLDEPFAALDEVIRQQLGDLLRALWLKRGMTVVFVTHSILESTYLSERAVLLSRRPGRVLLDRKLDLPRERSPELRTETSFARVAKELYDAFDKGGVT